MGQLQALTGKPGIIYTGYYFWVDNVGNPGDNLNAPLWVAAYTASPNGAWCS
jgi:lysozyme